MTHPRVQDAVRTIRGEAGKIVQSMYFEGNPATWAHQDSYYLDAEVLGRMVGAWIAVEDIAPGAGRFFIYPGSHRLDVARNGGKVDKIGRASCRARVCQLVEYSMVDVS